MFWLHLNEHWWVFFLTFIDFILKKVITFVWKKMRCRFVLIPNCLGAKLSFSTDAEMSWCRTVLLVLLPFMIQYRYNFLFVKFWSFDTTILHFFVTYTWNTICKIWWRLFFFSFSEESIHFVFFVIETVFLRLFC